MRIFITGGTGFVGKHVIKKFDFGNNKILALTRQLDKLPQSKRIKAIKGDLSTQKSWANILKEFKPEVAIHLAWEGIPDFKSKTSTSSLIFSLNLVQLLAEIKCPTTLITGSLWEYGNQKGRLSEKLEVKPFNSFTAAKNSLCWLSQEIAKEHHMNLIWTRLFFVYGPGQRKESLIPYLISCARKKISPEIRNLEAKNDFIFVGDVADAIFDLIKHSSPAGIYNIGSGKLSSVRSIVNQIFKHFNFKPNIHQINQKGTDLLSYSYADINKIRKASDWKPKTTMKEGIARTINFFESQG